MTHHKTLDVENWFKLSLVTQLANVGSEAIRAINWKNKNNEGYSQLAFYRSLELLNLIKEDPKNRERLKEITITYEVLVDFFAGENIYNSTSKSISNYFNQFTYLN